MLLLPSGLYRDKFPYQLELMDEAIRMVAELDEGNETNYTRYNSLRMYGNITAVGYNETTARNLSRARVFSDPPGAYGTGLPGAVTASETWDNESELADLFMARMGNVYGQDVWGENYEDIFRMNLVDVDVGVHSDSSNLFGVIDNDDYYQYLGGLALAVRSLTGETPDLYVADLTIADNPQMTTLEEAFRKEFRSRYWNPKWIDGMMEHDYGGAREFAKFTEHTWGWDVMTPDMVTDEDWNRIFEVYINDTYDLDPDELFRNEHPYTYQSMTARMLEATRKGYWDAPDDMLETLVSLYAQSVIDNGPACCHHTCGNPILGDEYIPGLISAFGLSSDLNVEYGAMMESVTERGKTAAEGGVGKDTGKPANPSEQSNPSDDYVEGYEMEVETSEKFSTGLSFSGAPMIGMVLAITLMVVIYWGYRRRY